MSKPTLRQESAQETHIENSNVIADPTQFNTVHVTSPQGVVSDVSRGNLSNYTANGGRISTNGEVQGRDSLDSDIHNFLLQQKENSDNVNAALGSAGPYVSAGLGALEPLSMGVGHQIFGKAAGALYGPGGEDAYKNLVNAVEESHPVYHGLGQLAAYGAMSGAGDEPGLLGATVGAPAKIANGIGGLSSGILRTAATGAVENAIYGAQSAINENYLQNRPQTVESILYSAGAAGLLGGGISAGFHAGLGAFAHSAPEIGKWAESHLPTPHADIEGVRGQLGKLGMDVGQASEKEVLASANRLRSQSLNSIQKAVKIGDVATERTSQELAMSLGTEAASAGLNGEAVQKLASKVLPKTESANAGASASQLLKAARAIDSKAMGAEGAYIKNRLITEASGAMAKSMEAAGLADQAAAIRSAAHNYQLTDVALASVKSSPNGSKSVLSGTHGSSGWPMALLLTGHPVAAVGGFAGKLVKGYAKDAAASIVRRAIPNAEAGVAIQKAILDTNGDIAAQARKLVSGSSSAVTQSWVSAKMSRKNYDSQIAKYQSIASNGHPVSAHLSMVDPQLGAAADAKSAQIAANVMKRVQAIAPPMYPLGAAGKRVEPKSLSSDEMDVMRYIHATEEPRTVLRQARGNSLSKASVDALKDNYPTLYEQLVKEIMTEMSSRAGTPSGKKGLSLNKRAQISLLLGQPVDYTTDPTYIAAIQDSYAQQAAQKPVQEPPPPPAGRGNNAGATEAEKIEQ